MAIVVVGVSLWGARDVRSLLVDGGYLDDSVSSMRAERELNEKYAAGTPLLLFVLNAERTADPVQVASAGHALTDRLERERGVVFVRTPWNTGDRRLMAGNGRKALVLVRPAGTDSQAQSTANRLMGKYVGRNGPFRIEASGRLALASYLESQSRADLSRIELITLPIVAVALFVVFGSLAACLVPLAVGAVVMTGGALVLEVLAAHTPMSAFALNMMTLLGFALAVDYGLILVLRFREELPLHGSVAPALRSTMRTAGRTVAMAAGVVALPMSVLLFLPTPFYRSLGVAAVSVVVIGAATALVLVPALLAIVGMRVGRRPLSDGERWQRLSDAVTRRPVVVAGSVAAVLALLAVPFAGAHFGAFDYRWFARDAVPRVVAEQVRTDFPMVKDMSLTVLLPGAPPQSEQAALAARKLSQIDGLRVVAGPVGSPDKAAGGSWYSVSAPYDPSSTQARDLVGEVRSRLADQDVMVAGDAAALEDMLDRSWDYLAIAAVVVVLAVGLLLFLYCGSVLVPIKALALNVLSMGASFGAMVVLFQDGWLSGPLGGSATGQIDPVLPVIVFCVAFGVSMDYEVFLVARIREEYLRNGDHRLAVAAGLRRTGRMVTAAAATLVLVMGGLAMSSMVMMQLIGVTLALAVALDATLVRCLLAPAVMMLAGKYNWWAPPWLLRIRGRLTGWPTRRQRPAEADIRVPA
ncbi:MMPL family transporter [Streptomyces sp. NRRL B-1677]|uniref:MMPL family transporter n=1 Tax=Streptomyces sp. NRRL B-1677 TaxID=2682966 RepID=UPI001892D0EB|nr:MMPL family transporter [Streptomyces sp. NRRL B-1677]